MWGWYIRLCRLRLLLASFQLGKKYQKVIQTFLNFFKNANWSDPKQQICSNQECGHQGGHSNRLIANAKLLIVNLIVRLIFDATAVYCFSFYFSSISSNPVFELMSPLMCSGTSHFTNEEALGYFVFPKLWQNGSEREHIHWCVV